MNIFSNMSGHGQMCKLVAADVNKYIKSYSPYTAKDFRTFNANKKLLYELDKIPLNEDVIKLRNTCKEEYGSNNEKCRKLFK